MAANTSCTWCGGPLPPTDDGTIWTVENGGMVDGFCTARHLRDWLESHLLEGEPEPDDQLTVGDLVVSANRPNPLLFVIGTGEALEPVRPGDQFHVVGMSTTMAYSRLLNRDVACFQAEHGEFTAAIRACTFLRHRQLYPGRPVPSGSTIA